ncbi:transcriptional regulator GcvA [uncultured Tateyamaria sp.]|uniref:transcriptional regulator GcvA n=1 Tax=uncultured Tateyamaria sp. TaxID=455651 RepID=UPI0026174098|nr:transcriptional regulator GcvA [uncultured Tateyamaria sp.]
MPDRLPPLTALRAFDAAARHMSFAKAAEELHVTPAALSFQIKSLEEHLGTQVFHRLNRAVELTEAGRAMAPGMADGFQTLAAAWRAAERTLDTGTLTVTAGPAFTAKWLAPRLYDFAQAHPEIELHFSASLKMVDLNRDGVDVAIRFGTGKDEDMFSKLLAMEWVCPVMTPELAAQYPTPESLKDAPLIFDDSIVNLRPSADWSTWFRMMGIDFAPTHGARFSQADHAVDAALAGMGVTLGRRSLVVKDMHDGRLVAPWPNALDTGVRFRFLCAEGAETRPHIAAFLDWMIVEIDKTSYITDRMIRKPSSDFQAA